MATTTKMQAKTTAADSEALARILADTTSGLRRVDVLLAEMADHLCEDSERGCVIRTALHDAATAEVVRLLGDLKAAR